MIRTDCGIEKPSRPETALCWNPDCRQPLKGSQRKWCGRHTWCGSWWRTNHSWNLARSWVVFLACTLDHHRVHEAKNGFWTYDYTWIPRRDCLPQCAMCGRATGNPEVDHITPMNGDDRTTLDCRNHHENLRVLCRDCHKGVTRRQATYAVRDQDEN